MEEMTFPILVDEPGPPVLRAGAWMSANRSAIKLVAPEVRDRSAHEDFPVPVRFTLVADGEDPPRV